MKVIGFFGSDSQVGVSMIAESISTYLSEKGSVLLISASGEKSVSYIKKETVHSLDYIRPNLLSGKLSKDDLEEIIEKDEKNGNLSFIAGVNSSYTSKLFPINTFDLILGAVNKYDYIVIDGGHGLDKALTISAFNACDLRYFVLTQQPKSIARFFDMKNYVLKPLGLEGEVIINKYIKDLSFYKTGEIEKMLGNKVSFLVPYSEYGWQAEYENKTLMKEKRYRKEIEKFGKYIESGSLQREPRGIFSRRVHKQ